MSGRAGRFLPVAPAVLAHARPYRAHLLAMAVLSVLGSLAEAASLFVLVTLATAVARAGGGVPLAFADVPLIGSLHIRSLVALGIVLAIGRALALSGAAVVGAHLSSSYEMSWKRSIYSSFLAAGWPTQADQLSGSFQNLLISDVEMGRSAMEFVGRGMMSGTSFAIMVAAALAVSPASAVVMVAVALLLAALVRPVSRFVRAEQGKLLLLRSEVADEVTQSLQLSREIKTFGVASHFRQRMEHLLERSRGLRCRIECANGGVGVLYQTVVLLGAIGGLGAVYLVDPRLLATVGPAVLLLLRSLSYSQMTQTAIHSLRGYEPSVQRLSAELAALRASREAEDGADLDAVESIRLAGASFSYIEGTAVLKDIELGIRRGEVVGVIGPSGGGKSTLAQVLLRLRQPSIGQFLVNAVPAASVSQGWGRRRVAYLPQEPILLNDSIAGNIRFGRDDVSDADIIRAAREAAVDDEIQLLPGGYDAVAGEGGRRLSGGQRQRICLARALVCGPDLLVVDEPTSALDAHSEHRVRAALEALRGRVAVLIIAHRPSTLEICDRIVVLTDGVVEADAPRTDIGTASTYFRSVADLATARMEQ